MSNSRKPDSLRSIKTNCTMRHPPQIKMETTSHERPPTRISKGAQMKSLHTFRIVLGSALLWSTGFVMAGVNRAQQVPEQLFSEMKWRMIGPFRAGKVNAVVGVP